MPDRIRFTRREAMAAGAIAVAGLASADTPRKSTMKGNIKQSVVAWCFMAGGDKWSLDQTCDVTKSFGVPSVEIVGPEDFATLKKHGLTCAIASNTMPGAPFKTGFNNPKYHDELVARYTKVIDACADFGCPSVIGFTGYKFNEPDDPKSGEISLEEGAKNCIAGMKRIIGHAEKKGINLCIEHLNTRDDSHPMKGHPGYQGDDLDYVCKILRAIGSPRAKLLFDVYHVQIMHGDVIRRIEQCKDVIGHIHTAGNPGRGELDDTQEINYPPIMRKLLAIKYAGFVGQEFIPTRDPKAGLAEAFKLCDV
ncbi:MAG TPA: TIM barrel protein [Gemmataceae bacterium]|jgi:hydroxypyruvate isomerase|nr:TIM barrel protein [Gemmataceae bacterium]